MPPRSIRELAEESRQYEFSSHISFRSWVHVARTLHSQANIYYKEHIYDQAYVLYSRFADLVVNSLPRHPELSDANAKKQLRQLMALVPPVLEQMEVVKGVIEKQIEVHNARLRQAKLQRLQAQSKETKDQAKVQANEHHNAKESVVPVERSPQNEDSDDLAFLETLNSLKRLRDNKSNFQSPTTSPQSFAYPSPNSALASTPVHAPEAVSVPPEVPARPWQEPAVEEKEEIVHKSRGSTEGGAPLRTVFLPQQLRDRFLTIAQPNTGRNLETCGILCGKLNRNAFFITDLVIPKQESTSDTCQTTDEIGLFEYIDKNDLFILGWIHTHPSQSCFLSSVDLHTQTSYQIMLPEAVAIVCAPQHNPSWGVFRLTDPPGVDVIKKCRQSALFHPHPESNLYKHAHNPGHVVINSTLPFKVEDLRDNPN
uniref:Regulator of free ubiquitin chains 1 n=1 Tax=Blastobotrys adeninivorans TaxID=409370 RepID=A0A060T5L2_BLAAD